MHYGTLKKDRPSTLYSRFKIILSVALQSVQTRPDTNFLVLYIYIYEYLRMYAHTLRIHVMTDGL